MKKHPLIPIILLDAVKVTFAQDTLKQQRFNFHFQQTIITQYKPSFSVQNSLSTNSETQSSITSTLYGAARLWKGAEAYFNLILHPAYNTDRWPVNVLGIRAHMEF